jgi:hypothetical protein
MRSVNRSAGRRGIARLLAVVASLALFGVDCKSPTSPKGNGEADISITNDYGTALDIYVDGAFKFTLRWKTTIEIDDVTLYHEYKLEAREPGTGKLIETTLIDVQAEQDYAWTINAAPRFKVINDWSEAQGEKLAISMDGVFQFNLERGESRMIMQVDFGERFLAAVNSGTGGAVASISFNVNANKTYVWDIKRISSN